VKVHRSLHRAGLRIRRFFVAISGALLAGVLAHSMGKGRAVEERGYRCR
jgi:hypothetical protein